MIPHTGNLIPAFAAFAYGSFVHGYAWRRRSRGLPVTARHRVAAACGAPAVMVPALGLGALSNGPAPTDLAEKLAALAVVGLVPLAAFLAFDIPLRLVRRWESARAG